jgi:uncharacterized protein
MRFLILALTLAACQAAPPAERVSAVPTEPALLSPSPAGQGPTVSFGTRRIPVEVADTPDSRRKGLSGRPSLAQDTGLVLAWPSPTVVGIWMPDMKFAIDVIFVRDSRVVFIEANARPCPSMDDCPTFGPDTPVDYVLEVPAGSVARWGLKTGDAMQLSGNGKAQPDGPEEF